jgi:hypothetical protein
MATVSSAQQQMINLQAAQLAAQVAQQAAQQEFQRMRFTELEQPQFAHLSEMDKEQLAFQKAQQAFTEAFQTASLTGQWNGAPTTMEQQRLTENQMNEAQLTGMYQGQQTTAEQQRLIANAMSEAGITGMYQGQQTAAERAAAFERAVTQAGLTGTYEGQQTIDWLARQAGITGYFNNAPTLQREQMQNENSLSLLNLQSQLRGPRNAFQYANLIASTPQGLLGDLNAMIGRSQVPASAGYQPGMGGLQPANLGTMYGDMLGGAQGPGGFTQPYAPQASPAAAQVPAYMMGGVSPVGAIREFYPRMEPANTPFYEQAATQATTEAASPFQMNPVGQQAPSNLYNYQPTGDGRFYTYPPGMMAPPEAQQYSSSVPQNVNEIQRFQDSLPLGSQISSSYWNQAPQYTKDVMMSGYEARGDDAGYIEEQYKKSLPKYTGERVGSFI